MSWTILSFATKLAEDDPCRPSRRSHFENANGWREQDRKTKNAHERE
jgi:hypothetical protein